MQRCAEVCRGEQRCAEVCRGEQRCAEVRELLGTDAPRCKPKAAAHRKVAHVGQGHELARAAAIDLVEVDVVAHLPLCTRPRRGVR